MNFADAIRQARHEAGDSALPSPVPKSAHSDGASGVTKENTAASPATQDESTDLEVRQDNTGPAGTVVRLELFLSPEQLSAVFRAALATQHTVLTLREASHHLRVSTHLLEEMARDGEIPAFLVDGKWRFPRNGLDEWLNLQASRKEAI